MSTTAVEIDCFLDVLGYQSVTIKALIKVTQAVELNLRAFSPFRILDWNISMYLLKHQILI